MNYFQTYKKCFALLGLLLFIGIAAAPSICADKNILENSESNSRITVDNFIFNGNSSNPPIITWFLVQRFLFKLERADWMFNVSCDVDNSQSPPEFDIYYPLLFIRGWWLWAAARMSILFWSDVYYRMGLEFPLI
jgi:hypothetical protein